MFVPDGQMIEQSLGQFYRFHEIKLELENSFRENVALDGRLSVKH